ncbi:MAG: CinA family protein [Chloroflexi bacterium]|nr:MAG: CinA family protein [Chloroflexota bacterium]TME45211.1 MAG: CinA family protein [Chloroflexota bacterium]
MAISGSLGPSLTRLGDQLRQRDLTVAVAESMTAGLLAATLADLPESSKRFLGGVVSYTADKKMELLGIPEAVISKDGVVSQATARLMAEGARRLLGAGLAISITGVAGPEEQDGKPVGLTYIGVSVDGKTQVREYHWPGGRATNRVASVEAAIELAADVLSSASG